MKAKYILIPLGLLLLLVILQLVATLSATTAGRNEVNTALPRDITYSYKDKRPYGGYVAYHWLQQLWDDKKPSVITRSFASAYNKNASMKDGGNIYVILANHNYTSPGDLRAMKSFVEDGNTLVLGICRPDSALDAIFGFRTAYADGQFLGMLRTQEQDTVTNFLSPLLDQRTFMGGFLHGANYFTAVDTAVTTILATDHNHKATFITIAQGSGRVLILLDPVALTNYPLLSHNNHRFMENVFGYVPNYVNNNTLYWDEFYKYQTAPRTDADDSNGLFALMKRYPPIRWAVWLTLLTVLFYIAFESKRRQRIIPEIPPVANTSVEFVKTMGKLYFEHHNNTNLAGKMAMQLLEYIRNRYSLNTQELDEAFMETLSRKSGYPPEDTRALVYQALQARQGYNFTDEDLHAFYTATHQFYQNN